MRRDELNEELEKSKKRAGRAPWLGVGTYLLMVVRGRLIADEFTREKPVEQQNLAAAVVQFKVIEASPGAVNPVGTLADWYQRLNAVKKWAHDQDVLALNAFVEGVTGSDAADLDMRELFDGGDMQGLIVRCQVVPGKKSDYPDFYWTHVEQTPEDVERRRSDLEE